jgi:Glycosyltransferase
MRNSGSQIFVVINALRLHEGATRHTGGNFFHVRNLLIELLPLLKEHSLGCRVLLDQDGARDLGDIVDPLERIVINDTGVWAQERAIHRAISECRPSVYYRPTGQLPMRKLPCLEVMGVADLNFKTLSMPWRKKAYKELSYWLSLRRANHVICISDFTRKEVLSHYKIAPERVSTVHHGASDFSRLATDEVAIPFSDFWMTFGHQAHKNVETILRVMAKDEKGRHRLVVVGKHDHIETVLKPLAAELQVSARVHFCGRLSDPQLAWMYRHACGLLFVSLFEGFGLPVLEAMSVGCPVIASDVCSIPEIASRGAILVDPLSVDELRAAMDRVISDDEIRMKLVSDGRQNAALFTWKRSASETLRILTAVAAQQR